MSDTHAKILVAEDEADIRDLVAQELQQLDEGFDVVAVASGNEALRVLTGPNSERPDIVLLDHFLGDLEGTDILQEMQDRGIEIPVIVTTGRGMASRAIKAAQLGAVAYVGKPYSLDQVVALIRQTLRRVQMRDENVASNLPEVDLSEKLIGSSDPMMRIYTDVGLIARTGRSILITGENGTGKTMLAELIHQSSDRRRGPFISMNCAGIPENLLEGELFGGIKGAWTGLNNDRAGKFEAANKGTIFLDEIGEMSLNMQSKLLDVIQRREVTRLGSTTPVKVDIRIVTATNKNLALEVQEKRFRQDLYFRLEGFVIHMPSLRERVSDIPLLVAHFLERHRYHPTSPPAQISKDAMEKLETYSWPGNVRELENVVARATILSRGEMIMPEHITFTETVDNFALDVGAMVRNHNSLDTILAASRNLAVRAAIRQSGGNVQNAATLLGISPAEVTAIQQAHEL